MYVVELFLKHYSAEILKNVEAFVCYFFVCFAFPSQDSSKLVIHQKI